LRDGKGIAGGTGTSTSATDQGELGKVGTLTMDGGKGQTGKCPTVATLPE
tara:strand:+ start:6096 stop:6245 length:150 start_codon:yes stop_codon:yes gene_type:complete